MSHRSLSSVSTGSIDGEPDAIPAPSSRAPSSRSTCASLSDAWLPPPEAVDVSEPSLLERAAQVRARFGMHAQGGERITVPALGELTALSDMCFARYGIVGHDGTSQMSSDAFASLCKDCGLADERLSSHINLIFARVTRPGFVMNASQLVTALAHIAKRKGCSVSEVHEALRTCVVKLLPVPSPAPGASEQLPGSFEIEKHASFASIEGALTSGEAVLLKGRWLLELCHRGGTLPARRDLPQKAAWSPDIILNMAGNYLKCCTQAKAAVIASVSCFWLSFKHPDPDGQHLRALCQSIQTRLDNGGKARRHIDEIAIFWDYACLQEGEQSVSAEEDLNRSMARRNIWLMNPNVEVWLVSEESPGVSACSKSCCS
mmetsp:Transcript_30114/g.64103  ORF Transcript_30114/g.64103 Transcript_30114/m.64103 type:complete len:374 (-) Transcript_30114:136-1257(-)